jgi:predicted nuclease of predicted toxin-antitoxin system
MAKLKFLLDENVGVAVAAVLRRRGYAVASIAEDCPGAKDKNVLQRAVRERRILTLDKDFGALAHQQLQRHTGIILLRLAKETPDNIARVLEEIIRQHGNRITGSFISASEYNVRIRNAKY